MRSQIEDVYKALDAEAYFAALALALTLPDICSQIEAGRDQGSRSLYTDWLNRWLCERFLKSSEPRDDEPDYMVDKGSLIYSIRCRVLHNGDTDLLRTKNNQTIIHFELARLKDMGEYGLRVSYARDRQGRAIKVVRFSVESICVLICDAVERFCEHWPNKEDLSAHCLTLDSEEFILTSLLANKQWTKQHLYDHIPPKKP